MDKKETGEEGRQRKRGEERGEEENRRRKMNKEETCENHFKK